VENIKKLNPIKTGFCLEKVVDPHSSHIHLNLNISIQR